MIRWPKSPNTGWGSDSANDYKCWHIRNSHLRYSHFYQNNNGLEEKKYFNSLCPSPLLIFGDFVSVSVKSFGSCHLILIITFCHLNQLSSNNEPAIFMETKMKMTMIMIIVNLVMIMMILKGMKRRWHHFWPRLPKRVPRRFSFCHKFYQSTTFPTQSGC